MSYQNRKGYDVVTCDLCGGIAAVGNRDWRATRQDAAGKTHHLCAECRPVARWCETHQQYHRPDDLHRTACVDCGGLFTSRYSLGGTRCPSCARAHAPSAPAYAASPRSPAHQGGIAGLFDRLDRALHLRHRG